MERAVRLDPRDILWRSRGRTWDYAFLAYPSHSYRWFDVLRQVYPTERRQDLEQTRAGKLPDDRLFVATTILDPVRRDAAQRPLVHYFIWTAPPHRDGVLEIPTDWGLQLLAHLAPAIDNVFDRPSEADIEHEAPELVQALPALELAGPPIEVPITITITIASRSLSLPDHSSASIHPYRVAGAIALGALLALLASRCNAMRALSPTPERAPELRSSPAPTRAI